MTEQVNESSESGPLDELVQLLRLDQVHDDRWQGGSCSRSLPFVFGGQVAAQSLSAAYHTVEMDRRVHSLHCYFLAAGDPQEPLTFSVDRVRDGRSFTVRRVTVTQSRGTVFVAMASFQGDEGGLDHGLAMPPATPPHQIPQLSSWLHPHRARLPQWWRGPMAIDLRYPQEPPHVLTQSREPAPHQQLWMRAAGPLPPEPRLHDCVLTFASDLTLLDPVLLAHGRSWYTDELRAASLDHAIWFHRQVAIDSWLLFDQNSPAAFGGLGLAVGHVFSESGALTATVAQQGVLRLLERD
jgi:acyl-CoA thioesterase-2